MRCATDTAIQLSLEAMLRPSSRVQEWHSRRFGPDRCPGEREIAGCRRCSPPILRCLLPKQPRTAKKEGGKTCAGLGTLSWPRTPEEKLRYAPAAYQQCLRAIVVICSGPNTAWRLIFQDKNSRRDVKNERIPIYDIRSSVFGSTSLCEIALFFHLSTSRLSSAPGCHTAPVKALRSAQCGRCLSPYTFPLVRWWQRVQG